MLMSKDFVKKARGRSAGPSRSFPNQKGRKTAGRSVKSSSGSHGAGRGRRGGGRAQVSHVGHSWRSGGLVRAGPSRPEGAQVQGRGRAHRTTFLGPATHATDMVGVGLVVVAHAAVVEVHGPCERSAAGIGRRRPVPSAQSKQGGVPVAPSPAGTSLTTATMTRFAATSFQAGIRHAAGTPRLRVLATSNK